jgi:type II secretory pathway pseudopilin PulG
MPMRRRLDAMRKDERGMTLIELIVATTAGMIIFAGLTAMVLGSMHHSTRVTNRVHATQDARRVVHRITNELHSSCVAQYVVPVQSESTRTKLSFAHAYGSEVTPVPIKTAITLSGTTLTQTDYPVASGSTPSWVFSGTPSSTRTILKNVSPYSTGAAVFTYFKVENGVIAEIPLTGTTELGTTNSQKVVQVNIAMKVTPPGETFTDVNADANVQSSAYLRFTSPTYATTKTNAPCE